MNAKMRFFVLTLMVFSCLAPSEAAAHFYNNPTLGEVDAEIVFDGERFNVDLHVPLGPFLDATPTTEEERQQQERFRERVIEFFETGIAIEFTDSNSAELDADPGTEVVLVQIPHYDEEASGTVPTWVARLEGAVPENANELQLILQPRPNQILGRIVFVARYSGGAMERVVTKEQSVNRVSFAARASGAEIVWLYLVQGVLHIVPKGLDHILFVLGLFLLSTAWKPLLWQVSAFTLAHSVTLGLSMAGVWQMPGHIVEPIIAASIVYVAVENIFTTDLNPWRPVLVFAFGLLHGLGFAGVLGEIGMPTDAFFTALLAFNVGVELGQLAVIAV
ncbi:MAG: HupE/UreJ family protein, partial [Myxococcota bacterium]